MILERTENNRKSKGFDIPVMPEMLFSPLPIILYRHYSTKSRGMIKIDNKGIWQWCYTKLQNAEFSVNITASSNRIEVMCLPKVETVLISRIIPLAGRS
jgi:hypothetical protein